MKWANEPRHLRIVRTCLKHGWVIYDSIFDLLRLTPQGEQHLSSK